MEVAFFPEFFKIEGEEVEFFFALLSTEDLLVHFVAVFDVSGSGGEDVGELFAEERGW